MTKNCEFLSRFPACPSKTSFSMHFPSFSFFSVFHHSSTPARRREEGGGLETLSDPQAYPRALDRLKKAEKSMNAEKENNIISFFDDLISLINFYSFVFITIFIVFVALLLSIFRELSELNALKPATSKIKMSWYYKENLIPSQGYQVSNILYPKISIIFQQLQLNYPYLLQY